MNFENEAWRDHFTSVVEGTASDLSEAMVKMAAELPPDAPVDYALERAVGKLSERQIELLYQAAVASRLPAPPAG